MGPSRNVVHTARTRTAGGREHGLSRSSDGRLDVRLAVPGSDRVGTSPEHLFAAAWSACFETSIRSAAQRRGIALPAGVAIDAEVDLIRVAGDPGHVLGARLRVRLPGVAPEVAQALVDDAHARCPYSRATRGNIDVAITLADPARTER